MKTNKLLGKFFKPFFAREACWFLCSGVLLAVASLFPEQYLGLLSAVLCASCMQRGVEVSQFPVRHGLLAGVVFHALAFYWLPDTMTLFGGFPSVVSYLLFFLFCVVSGFQFSVFAYLGAFMRNRALGSLCVPLAVSWMFAELAYPRLFPWAIGHTLIAAPEFAALAAYAGVPLCSVLVVWWGSVLTRIVQLRSGTYRTSLALLLFSVTSLLYVVGLSHIDASNAKEANAARLRVALVQGNLAVKEKGDVRLLNANIQRYRELSDSALSQGAELLLWPESVSNYWTPESLVSVRGTRFDPLPQRSAAILYGGLSYRERPADEYQSLMRNHSYFDTPEWREQLRYLRFNSVFALDANGSMLGSYHKKVLMPFGEYVPFSSWFPVLKTILPRTGDFTPGDKDQPIAFPGLARSDAAGTQVVPRVASLICYEDLIPELSREAVTHSANLLVNQTNDAWYGDTAAPYQHHLLAQWRAIESGRYLLRVTNTGLTAVVNAKGETQAALPIFEEGVLVDSVPLLSGSTVYSVFGDRPAWMISLLFVGYFFVTRARSSRESSPKSESE